MMTPKSDDAKSDDAKSDDAKSDDAKETKITLCATDALRDNERRLILAALAVTDGNRQRAAKMLGVSRKTLYNKLKQYRETQPKYNPGIIGIL
jgi:DNA-binding NtrC family response regulator